MTHPPLNQPPLFCRECQATYEYIAENGKCAHCDAHNIYQRFSIPVTLSFDAYSFEEALNDATELFKKLGIPVNITVEK